ncbi:MAG TPA: methyltransferase domain-containing protein [Bacteroidota bacterium]
MNRRTELVQRIINLTQGDSPARVVLDAGCGSASELRFGPGTIMVGIDISATQLQRNSRLSERILGDIQDYRFDGRSFDIVVCWDVLEHVQRPGEAVENLLNAVRPDGLIILGFPNLLSLKGLITKFTPHWFHTLVYRLLRITPNPGTDGNPPFRTFFRLSMAPSSIRRMAEERGFDLEGTATADVSQSKFMARHPLFLWFYRAADQALRLLTFGHFDDSEVVLVLRRRIAVQEVPVEPGEGLGWDAEELEFGQAASGESA